MTLNGVIALIFHFFSLNSIALLTNYVTVLEDRLSAEYRLPLLAKTD